MCPCCQVVVEVWFFFLVTDEPQNGICVVESSSMTFFTDAGGEYSTVLPFQVTLLCLGLELIIQLIVHKNIISNFINPSGHHCLADADLKKKESIYWMQEQSKSVKEKRYFVA